MLTTRSLILSVVAAATQVCFAADLFDAAGNLRPIAMNDAVVATDTVGGYAIYQGDGDWKFEQGKTGSSTGGAQPVPIASFIINRFVNGEMFQRLAVNATIGSSSGRSWSGTPCSVDHLVIKNKGRGRDDHCMTIDPATVTIGNKGITFLSIRITNSSGGRYHAQNLMVNPNLLGNRDTGSGEWTQAALAVTPYRKAFLDKLSAWAEKYLDASIKAFDYAQPQDAYSDLPSLQTLVPAVAGFPADKYSLGFLSALEDIKHRPGPKAMAYYAKSDTRTPNHYCFNMHSQEEADKNALEGCGQRRAAGDAECKLVPAELLQPSAAM